MKTWKYYFILFILLASTVTCFGWEITGEANTHGPINDAAVVCFSTNFVNSTKSLDEQTKFDGIAWHNGSDENIILNNGGVPRRETFKMWVKIGGIDADVESEDAERVVLRDIHTNVVIQTILIGKPLRHFYDPTCKENERYLTDFKDYIKNQFENPKIDHVQWALNKTEHHWSFDQGLRLYKAAMENKKSDDLDKDIAGFHGYFTSDEKNVRENLFSASFRALGETLHCAGDLCVPAHVRDDSHGGTAVGGLDPIENNIKFVNAQTILSQHSELPLNDFLNKQKTVKEILTGCAEFVNESFFSNDTICNDSPKVGPSTDIKKIYKAPSFSKKDLIQVGNNTKVFRVYADFLGHDGQPIILAQLEITSYLGMYTTETYFVPTDAAEKQASVLLPLAAAAGGEIIDRFLPTMKLGLTVEKDEPSGFKLIGSLTHEIEKDIEWQSIGEIKYNGFGEIHVNGSAIATATFIDGQMTATATFNDKDKIQLIVKAGALIHKSNIVEVSAEEIIPPSLISVKSPEFIQTLSSVGFDSSSRRIGYIITEIPDIIATIQSSNSKYMVFNWWVDNAVRTIADAYFGGEITATNLEEDSVWISRAFEQLEPGFFDFKTSFDFSRWQRGKLCIPSGEHVLHAEGYYHESFYSHGIPNGPEPRLGLLGVEGNYRTVSLDIPFEVQQLTSPAKQPVNNLNADSGTKREISFSKIETNPEAKTEGYSAPAWAPSNWHCLFKFDGAYTYYFDSKENSPDDKISGHYKDGNPDGLWEIKHWDKQWKFSYGSDGTIISGVEEYYKNELVKKYTSSSQANPNLLITHDHANDTSELVVRNALVETFGNTKEEYDLEDGKKNGSYSYANEYSTTANGSYLNDIPTGHWKIIDTYSRKEFDLDSEGNVLSGIEIYSDDGNLEFKYTSSDFVNPSFEAIFNAPTTLNVKTGKVEWFHDSVTEVYHIKDYKKEGPYNSADSSNGKTIQGQYENNSMTGVWTYFDPARNPSEYTKTY